MEKFLRNKELLKDTFQGVGYFVFIAGLIKFSAPYVSEQGLLYKLLCIFVLFALYLLSWFYVQFHVAGPIVKIYYPDFKVPFIDVDYVKPRYRDLIIRPDFRLYLLIGLPLILTCFEILTIGFSTL